ncbi:hypothetical protein ANN_04105 [Periplaneta americana]|uniref:Uncharacterized protein n=1 Tax=Periplaneta americana TaxID=6978 RepID=A0ABQ8T978_PERAM|nr:hypothetical protein ANN_04105 [Periplaneta americana]
MSPGSNTESYPAFAHIGLRENPGKNLNQVTCPDRESNPGHLVSRLDALTESLEQSPTKSQRHLSVQVGIKRTSCQNIIKKDLQLYPYRFTVVHALKRPDEPSRVEICRWFLSEVESGLLDPQFFISSDEAWFSRQTVPLTSVNRRDLPEDELLSLRFLTHLTPLLPFINICTYHGDMPAISGGR